MNLKHVSAVAALAAFSWLAPALVSATPKPKPTKAAPMVVKKGAQASADSSSSSSGGTVSSCGSGQVMCGSTCCDTSTEVCGDGSCHPKQSSSTSSSSSGESTSAPAQP